MDKKEFEVFTEKTKEFMESALDFQVRIERENDDNHYLSFATKEEAKKCVAEIKKSMIDESKLFFFSDDNNDIIVETATIKSAVIHDVGKKKNEAKAMMEIVNLIREVKNELG